METPSQTPDYLRRSQRKFLQQLLIVIALFSGGVILPVVGWSARTVLPGVVWVGVVVLGLFFLVVGVLIPVRGVINVNAEARKEQALRKLGTVEPLAVASSLRRSEDGDSWELTSELQIRLDSGPTFRGSYRASVEDWRLREWGRALDAWFCVGASLRCLYNPTNPDIVIVFPFAARGDEVTYNELTNTGPDHVSFYSAK